MRAWEVSHPAPVDERPLRLVDRPTPEPGPGQVRVRVSVCGVCRTDLHLAEGDLPVHRPQVVPGHEVVGLVDRRGPGADRFAMGDRVGVAWLATTCGVCRFCRRGAENLCPQATFTGWDHDGGYAEATVVDERFAYRLPETLTDEQAAPLLCAGIIGYRALRLTGLPHGGRLGIYGFGGSAHLTAQIALAEGADALRGHPLDRGRSNWRPNWVPPGWVEGDDAPPDPLDAAIVFAPVGRRGAPGPGRAGPRAACWPSPASTCPTCRPLDYEQHLFNERVLRSVTANTRGDGEELLRLAPRLGVRATTVPYRFDGEEALSDLAHDRFTGAAVLQSE